MQATDIFPVRTQTRYGFHVSPDALSLYARLVDEFPLPETRMAYLLEDAVYEERRTNGVFPCFTNAMLIAVFAEAARTYVPTFGPCTTVLQDVLAQAISDQTEAVLERVRRAALLDLDDRVEKLWEKYRAAVVEPSDAVTPGRALVDVVHEFAHAAPNQRRGCIEEHLARELMRHGEPVLVHPYPRLRRMVERYVLSSIFIPEFTVVRAHIRGTLQASSGYCNACAQEALAIALQRQTEIFGIAS